MNLSGSYDAASAFKLFSASTYSGMFTSLVPGQPCARFCLWNTNTLATDGTLRILQTISTTPTNLGFSITDG